MNKLKKYKFPIVFSSLCLTVLIAFQHCGKTTVVSSGTGILSDPLTSSMACSNNIVFGKWISTTDNSMGLTFTGDCHYINDFCKSTGTYPANIASDAGTVLIAVDSKASDAPVQCLPVGTTACQYQINRSVTPNQLSVLCGNVWGIYYRDPTSTSTSNTYVTTPVSNVVSGGTSGTTPGSTTPSGCDGISRTNATTCYYKNIPTVQVSGGIPGQIYWSSTTLPSSISQNQFVTDASFNVRIIPRAADPNVLSGAGKTCSPFTVNNSKKLKVQLMLRKQGVGLGEVITLTADRDTPSAKGSFTVPGGTTQPYILEVTSVLSDTRCEWSGGTSAIYCPYADIPVNTLGPTECVAFDIQYSTDDTYDLP